MPLYIRFGFGLVQVKLMPLAIGMFVCRKRRCRDTRKKKTSQNLTDLFIYTFIDTLYSKVASIKDRHGEKERERERP